MDRRRIRLIGFAVLLAVLTGGVLPEAAAQPRERCGPEREQAEDDYLNGRFDAAIGLLQTCVERDTLLAEEAVAVFRLLSLSYMNKGDLEKAQQAVVELLGYAPGYQADPIQDPPLYTSLVNLARAEFLANQERTRAPVPEEVPETPVVLEETPEPPEPFLGGVKKWLLVTGGAIVVFAAAVLAVGGGASDGGGQP